MELLKILPFALYITYLLISNRIRSISIQDALIYTSPIICQDMTLSFLYSFVTFMLLRVHSFYDILIRAIPFISPVFLIIIIFRSYEFRKSIPLPFLTVNAACTAMTYHHNDSLLPIIVVGVALIYDIIIIQKKIRD